MVARRLRGTKGASGLLLVFLGRGIMISIRSGFSMVFGIGEFCARDGTWVLPVIVAFT